MIISRTPFRVSFVGGGTDIKDFYSKNGYGSVISTTIQKYMYIAIHPYFHDKIRIKYSKTEDVKNIDDIKHPIIKECLKNAKINNGIEITSFADIPSGTGLGSSSTFTVGLLNALYAYEGMSATKEKLAIEACEIEINKLKEPIGKQDQYAASYGGLNQFTFNKDETVDIEPIILTDENYRKIENNFKLYYIGGARKSSDILTKQKKNISKKEKFNDLKRMLSSVDEFKSILKESKIDKLASLIGNYWNIKKTIVSNISNSFIDEIYNNAIMNGSNGGKLLGAGGAGFLLLHSKNHHELEQNIKCKSLPLLMDNEGSKIIFSE